MKRRLIALNLVLLALLGAGGWRLKQSWRQARERERAVLRQAIKPIPPPPVAPAPAVQPVTAASYAEVAQKMLFSRDRNPVVVVEVAPPKPMPPLPVLYGVMNVGDGPTAILSEKAGAASRGYRAGEKIGPFLLVAVREQELVFEWDGKQVSKKPEELVDRSGPAPAAGSVAMTPRGAPPAAAQGPIISSPAQSGPGKDMGGDLRACQPGDNAPAGTVQDGYRKVVTESPFGKVCRWEPVKK